MIAAFAVSVAVGIALPHTLRLGRVTPSTAASLWALSLALRALSAVFVVIYVVLFLPATTIFAAVTHWCWHAVLPTLATHAALGGREFGDVVVGLPVAVLAMSGVPIAVGRWRAARDVQRLMARETLGPGPQGSVIVGGAEVVLAAAGYARPRLVVSVGALLQLDDAELAAGLGHERGHITRHHRWILLAAELCCGLGRAVPGTRRAQRQLAFHLERDADAWAVRHHDRAALARAIGKAAGSRVVPPPNYGLRAGNHDVTRRLDELVDAPSPVTGVRSRLLLLAAASGTTLVVLLTSAVPATIAAGHADRDAVSAGAPICRQ